jgi:hypothetical protein
MNKRYTFRDLYAVGQICLSITISTCHSNPKDGFIIATTIRKTAYPVLYWSGWSSMSVLKILVTGLDGLL